jgi:hypothetical protein
LKFWKANQTKTLEDYLILSIHDETPFSLSMQKIPDTESLMRFKKKYENEFLKLDVINNRDYDDDSDASLSEGEISKLREIYGPAGPVKVIEEEYKAEEFKSQGPHRYRFTLKKRTWG